MAQVVFLCNAGKGRSRQHCIDYLLAKTRLCTLGQHCPSNFLVQCCRCCRCFGQHWLDNIPLQCGPSTVDTTIYKLFISWKLSVCHGPTLHRWFPCAMLTQKNPDTIVFLCKVVCALWNDRSTGGRQILFFCFLFFCFVFFVFFLLLFLWIFKNFFCLEATFWSVLITYFA